MKDSPGRDRAAGHAAADASSAAQRQAEKAGDDVPRFGLRPAEAAKALGISERKLWEITADQSSGIPHVRLNRTIIYPARELQDWLAQQVSRPRRG